MRSGLCTLHVLGLPALRAFDHVKLHLLTFLEAAEAARLNGREVHKYVFTVLAADETIAFGVVKPLHCSCFHGDANSFFLDVALKLWKVSSAGRSRAGLSGETGYCKKTLKSNASKLYVNVLQNATTFMQCWR